MNIMFVKMIPYYWYHFYLFENIDKSIFLLYNGYCIT